MWLHMVHNFIDPYFCPSANSTLRRAPSRTSERLMVLAMLLGARTPARAVRLQHAPVALAEGWSQPAFSTVFSESLSHGHCVLVKLPQKEQVGEDYRLPSELLPDLHARELAHMRDYRPARSVFFAGGRLALRRALWAMEAPGLEPILPGKNGAPVIPGRFVGSISHTHGLAAALVARRPPGEEGEEERMAVGIDVERSSRPTSSDSKSGLSRSSLVMARKRARKGARSTSRSAYSPVTT